MATIKSFTSLEQSKKLTEIIPLESADMGYNGVEYRDIRKIRYDNVATTMPNMESIPCWSLAALLSVLPISCDDGQHCLALINSKPNGEIEWLCSYEDCNGNLMMECYADNPVDACYEMILKLNELKML